MGESLGLREVPEAVIKGDFGVLVGAEAVGLVPGFGDRLVFQIRVKDVEDWKTRVAVLINEGRYKPLTANNWFTIFKTIMREAQHELEFGYDCFEKVKMFDESLRDP